MEEQILTHPNGDYLIIRTEEEINIFHDKINKSKRGYIYIVFNNNKFKLTKDIYEENELYFMYPNGFDSKQKVYVNTRQELEDFTNIKSRLKTEILNDFIKNKNQDLTQKLRFLLDHLSTEQIIAWHEIFGDD
jgi:hypothetical protein